MMMFDQALDTDRFSLFGGPLCLDFANTADWHASSHPVELLHSYHDLLAWSLVAGILTEREVAGLLDVANDQPTKAAEVLVRGVTLRESIYRIFSAHAQREEVPANDLAVLNREITAALMHLQVATGEAGDRFVWTWTIGDDSLDRMLWPIARSTGELLTSANLDRVRECAGHPCGWLFLDTSRNRSRRWCNMQSCGNRAKARRHYERSRVGGSH